MVKKDRGELKGILIFLLVAGMVLFMIIAIPYGLGKENAEIKVLKNICETQFNGTFEYVGCEEDRNGRVFFELGCVTFVGLEYGHLCYIKNRTEVIHLEYLLEKTK